MIRKEKKKRKWKKKGKIDLILSKSAFLNRF